MSRELRFGGGVRCSAKGPPIADYLQFSGAASRLLRQRFGLGHEVLAAGYGVLSHPIALLYGGVEPRR